MIWKCAQTTLLRVAGVQWIVVKVTWATLYYRIGLWRGVCPAGYCKCLVLSMFKADQSTLRCLIGKLVCDLLFCCCNKKNQDQKHLWKKQFTPTSGSKGESVHRVRRSTAGGPACSRHKQEAERSHPNHKQEEEKGELGSSGATDSQSPHPAIYFLQQGDTT